MRKPNLPPGARSVRQPARVSVAPSQPPASNNLSAGKVNVGKVKAAPTKTSRAGLQTKRADNAKLRQQRSAMRAEAKRFKRSGQVNVKRVFGFSVLGSIVLLCALVLATVFTPLLAIEKIEIVGLKRLNQQTVLNSVRSLIGTPLTVVNQDEIQQRLSGFPLVASFNTVALSPHTLQIRIQERQPIGVVQIGQTNYLYDPAGVQIGPTRSGSKYPLILLNGDPATAPSYRAAVSVLLALPLDLYPKVASIQATSVDDVRIKLRGVANRQILWGDSSSSTLKSRVVTALMANLKRQVSVVIDVSSPSAPTVRYGNF